MDELVLDDFRVETGGIKDWRALHSKLTSFITNKKNCLLLFIPHPI
jgi:hypothetical protein